jgi:hypothetical protein
MLGLICGVGPYVVLQKGAPIFLAPKIEKAFFNKGKLVGNRDALHKRVAQFTSAFEGDRVFFVRDGRRSIERSIPLIGPALASYVEFLAKGTNASMPEGLGRDPIEPMLSRIRFEDAITLIEVIPAYDPAVDKEEPGIFHGTMMASCMFDKKGEVIRLELVNHFPGFDMTDEVVVEPIKEACKTKFKVPTEAEKAAAAGAAEMNG